MSSVAVGGVRKRSEKHGIYIRSMGSTRWPEVASPAAEISVIISNGKKVDLERKLVVGLSMGHLIGIGGFTTYFWASRRIKGTLLHKRDKVCAELNLHKH